MPLCISQCTVVSWRYVLHNYLGWFIQRHASGTSSDNEWINWLLIHLLLLFALASDIMRNDPFVLKILIPNHCSHAKRSLTKMTTRCHSLWLVVTCSHSLSLVARLVVTSCHSLYTTCCHSLSLDISDVCVFISNPRKTSTDQKKHLHVLYKMNRLTIMKMFKENLKSCFSKRNLWLY